MNRLHVPYRTLIGLGLVLNGASVLAAPRPETTPVQSNSSGALTLPAATIQVTEKAGLLSVAAEHADVQSLLKVVFDQMNRQFSINNSVTGQVTLRLINQPLRVVLDNICQQTFLRYRFDPGTSIYQFTQDEEAIRAAFTRIRALNATLRDQLRLMGLDVPADAQIHTLRSAFGGALSIINGGPGGSLPDQHASGALPSGNMVAGLRSASPGAVLNQQPQRDQNGVNEPQVQQRALQSSQASRGSALAAKSASGGGFGGGAAGGAGALATADSEGLPAQNNLVAFNIPGTHPLPVADVLLQLGRQANVPIVLDADIPLGVKFRIHGKMPARTLPEALNTLAPVAHLEWRWVGNTIFVTTTPDFWIEWNSPGSVIHSQVSPQQSSGKPQDAASRKNTSQPQSTPKKD